MAKMLPTRMANNIQLTQEQYRNMKVSSKISELGINQLNLEGQDMQRRDEPEERKTGVHANCPHDNSVLCFNCGQYIDVTAIYCTYCGNANNHIVE